LKVEFTRHAFNSLSKLPAHILSKVKFWVAEVELHGLRIVRFRPGYHDEPLKGLRQGQRSVRLNRNYRLIYLESARDKIQIIVVMEVTNHEY
jgi:proteic killer suppression protein